MNTTASDEAKLLFPPVNARGLNSPASSTLRNWCGITPLAMRHQIRRPSTTDDIVRLLTVERPTGQVKVVGSGLSYEPIAAVDLEDRNAILLDMSWFNSLERIEEGSATFGAGTQVDAIIAVLTERGLMLPCSPGVIGMQTIAGAISTGTHGQGMEQACLSDIVLEMVVINADGSITTVTNSDVNFNGYICSLGSLGIIRSITIQTQPIRSFFCEKSNCSYNEFAQNWMKWNYECEFAKAWWYPETDLVHVWRISQSNASVNPFLQSSGLSVDTTLNDTIDLLSQKMAHQTNDPTMVGCHFATIDRFRDTLHEHGHLHELVCKGIPVPQINCEIAVPISRLSEALSALRSWLAINGSGSLHYPFIFRCTGQSRAWLSPATTGPVCYIGFLVYLSQEGTWYPGSMSLMHSLQTALHHCGGIPHFGKHFSPEIFPPRTIVPKFQEFERLRLQCDPNGRFMNDFLHRIFDLVPPKPKISNYSNADATTKFADPDAVILAELKIR